MTRSATALVLLSLTASAWSQTGPSTTQSLVPPDEVVNAWVTKPRTFPVDPNKPVGPNNPIDPKKEGTVAVFACRDGRFEITEYRNDPDHPPVIKWAYIDPRRPTYLYYRDPMEPVKRLKDPYAHAIALSAYNAANGRPLGLMADAGLTPDQLAAKKKAREEMKDKLTLIGMAVDGGTYHADLMGKVMSALDAYRRAPGDPTGDNDADLAKAQLAREVLKASAVFLNTILDDRSTIIEEYIASLNILLTPAQKESVITKAAKYEESLTRPATRSSTRPATRPATMPDRG